MLVPIICRIFVGEINETMGWISEHRRILGTLAIGFAAFLLGLVVGIIVPSPFFHKIIIREVQKEIVLVDTVNMPLNEGLYSGSVIQGTQTRQGYGVLTTNDGTVYEGDWKNDELPYGIRTTPSSVYTGKFDKKLNNHGFGIIEYTQEYINNKRSKGLPDEQIVTKYIGNWAQNNKEGLGRAVKLDGSMEFGRYASGLLMSPSGANYQVGDRIYGIDASHHQTDIDWDHLAIYCDKDGKAYSNRASDKTYMQPAFFVYLKATEGATIKDELFGVRMIEAERHGLAKGVYHFLHLGSPIEAQLRNFLEVATWTPGDLPPALDIEVSSEVEQYGKDTLYAMTLEWLRTVEARWGVRPIIYTSNHFRETYFNDARFKDYSFWMSRYGSSEPTNSWSIWQYTERGQICGNEGSIDINLFQGNYDAFQHFLNGVNTR